MIISEDEEHDFQNATHCNICEKELGNDRVRDANGVGLADKVRDHCHFTGKYRGATHNGCNINFNLKHFEIPIFFHNLKGYDANLIISEYINFSEKRFSGIPQNTEKLFLLKLEN